MLAEAIVVSVQRFYLSPEVDAHTGVLQISEIRDSFQGAWRSAAHPWEVRSLAGSAAYSE